MTEDQESAVLEMLEAYENGKRIADLDDAEGSLSDMTIEVTDETGETHKMGLSEAVETASNPIAGRYWDETNATPTAAGYYGSLQALKALPTKLGLGRYLVTDDLTRRKLDPTDSTKYEDGSDAALDGSEGQCMWCWNAHYFTTWKEGSNTIMAVTFSPIDGKNSIYVPEGGISWFGAGVVDRTNLLLCSLISDDEQYRGGANAELSTDTYTNVLEGSAQQTMLGMPATSLSTTTFGTYARNRGEGWEANWFVARAVVEYLIEIIMGTRNVQADYVGELDDDGLYQGGFGSGVTGMSGWSGYNGTSPLLPTCVGLEAGDDVCLVDYDLPDADGEAYQTFSVPVFFGLVGAGFGHLGQWVRGVIVDYDDGGTVYVTGSMYEDYDPDSVDDKIAVSTCPSSSAWIVTKSYEGLCCTPTAVGGSAATYFSDYLWVASSGLRVRGAGGSALSGVNAGVSASHTYSTASDALTHYSSPLCYFAEDPTIEA